MNKSEEALRDEIKKHPKGIVARAYRLGHMDAIDKPEPSTQGKESLDRATMIKKRGKHRIYSW